MKKHIRIFALALAVVAAFGMTGCAEPVDESSKYGDLAVFFGADNLTVEAGGTLSVPFSVLGSEGVVLNLEAESSDVEIALNLKYDATYSGSIELSAPKVVVDQKEVTVTLKVSDKHGRSCQNSTVVTILKSEELAVSLTDDVNSMAALAGKTFSLPFKVIGKGDAVINEQVSLTVTSGWTASCTWNHDKTGGSINVTPPAALTSTLEITMSITDSYNRTATLQKQISIVAISIAENAANCHIAAPGSTVTIKAVKGNSTAELDFSNASLLWQDNLGMVKSVSGNPTEKVVVIELSEGKSGNAVVAAKKDGVIVWSWHLWVTDYEPDDDPFVYTYTDGTTSETYTFMDRNLGAMNAKKFDVGSYGLLYQWGRKDPFVGADGLTSAVFAKKYDIDGSPVREISEQRPTYPSSDYESTNLELSIQNPTVFYYSNDGNITDWFTHDTQRQNHDLWGGKSNVKTIYDPCPEGWIVPPAGNCWSFCTEYTYNADGTYAPERPWYIESEEGKNTGFRYKTTDGKEYWFPLTGDRHPHDGVLKEPGEIGDFHTRTPDGTFARLRALAYRNPATESGMNRAYGSSVRCIKEK